MEKPPPCSLVPSSLTFNWTKILKCKCVPREMKLRGPPVALNRKLYISGVSKGPETVLVYTPDQDHWDELTPPPVKVVTLATLRGQLLAVGGRDRSTNKTTNTILTFDESSQRWLQSLPLMPVGVTFPAVVEYQDHLIVAGGRDSNNIRTTILNILDTTTNKWIPAEPLPDTDRFDSCLFAGQTMYLIGRCTKQVFRADVPSLISRASSGVWETVASVPWYHSYLATINNTLIAVGGRDDPFSLLSDLTSDIYLYDPTKGQWTKCGDLHEPMHCHCTYVSNNLYVFDLSSSSVYDYVNPVLNTFVHHADEN